MSVVGRKLLKEKSRRDRFSAAVEAAAGELFDKQTALYNSKSKRLIARAGRRGGKTSTAVPFALRAAAKFPGSMVPVCEKTLSCSAANAFWKALQAFDAEHGLNIRFRHTVKEATMPNGSRVQLFGVDTLELADKLRGDPYSAVVVDEMGTFRSHVVEYLLDDVLTASLADYDAPILLLGTPGPRKAGHWFELCHNPAWEQHHWTLLDNPKLGKQAYQHTREWRANWLKELLLEKNWMGPEYADRPADDVIAACQHPKFMREYMGLWVDGFADRMYDFDRLRNLIPALPPTDGKHPWRYGRGIDLGFNDPTAFTISAVRKDDPRIYLIESKQETHMIPSSIAVQLDRYDMQYGNAQFTVADTGGSGKMAVEELNQKYGTNILPAQKRDKRVFVEHVNGELLTGRIQIVGGAMNADLIEDLETLPWNDDETDAADGFADHLPDSFLYNVRHWTNIFRRGFGEKDAPEVGSEEWTAAEEEKLEALGDELSAHDNPPASADLDFDEAFLFDEDGIW